MDDTRLSAVFDFYRKSEIIAAGLSKKTFEAYFYAGKLAVEFFGDAPVETIMPEDVRDFYAHLLTWQKPDTARGNIICLRAILRLCSRKGLKVMDIEDIKVPKREKRKIDYLTETEIAEFIKVVGQKRRGYANTNRVKNVAIVELLYATGIRVGELCALNRNSIKNRQFTVVGKSKSPRICFITERVEKMIGEYMTMRDDKDIALFVSNQSQKRMTPHRVREIFECACARSDFNNIHPHTIRHSFATKMLEREVDLRYIGEFLGHESLDTTKIYTHFSNPKLRRIYDMANA